MSYDFKGTMGEWYVYEQQPARLYTQTLFNKLVNSKDECHELANCCARSSEKAEANAKLIAAAPKMFELLKKILKVNNAHNFNGHLINEQIHNLLTEITK